MKHRTIINIFTGLALAAAVAVIALISIILTGKSHLYNAADRIVEGNNCDGGKTNEAVIFNREPYVYKKGLINILVLGIDGEGNLYDNHSPGDMGQSDAVYVVSIDTQSKATHVVGIPRDTMTTIEMSDKDGNTVAVNTGQVTLQYGYGQDIQQCTSLMAKSVSGILYNIHIDKVVVLSVNSIAIINDAVGGVKITATSFSPYVVVYSEKSADITKETDKSIDITNETQKSADIAQESEKTDAEIKTGDAHNALVYAIVAVVAVLACGACVLVKTKRA